MDSLLRLLPNAVSWAVSSLPQSQRTKITEISLKKKSPCAVFLGNERLFVSRGCLNKKPDEAVILEDCELSDFLERVCRSSVYSFEEQLKNGFIPLDGGHRVGLCGTAVIKNGEITGIRDIGGFVIRIAREMRGCGEEAAEYIKSDGQILNTLIVSPPGGGKTTMLRDIARIFSEDGKRVCVVDERSEIMAVKEGVSCFKSMRHCDYIDAIPKAQGILQAVRTLAPEVVLFDEIGTAEEAKSVCYAMNSGVSFVFSAHAPSFADAIRRPAIKLLLENDAVDAVISLGTGAERGKIKEVKYIKNGENENENSGAYNNSFYMRFYRDI